jgi:hypothetical protein
LLLFVQSSAYFIGHKTGWDTEGAYPHVGSQGVGAFLFYGLSVILLAGKYLRGTLRMAFRNEPRNGELVSYRTAWGLLLLCAIGLFVWARGLGSSSAGALTLVGMGYVLALVFMKVRTECGVPGNTLFAGRILLYIPAIGGLAVIGPSAFGLNAELGGLMSMVSILVIAGLQLEFLQMARMYGIKRHHVPMTLLLALLCGVFIGGWFMLSGSYATGTENWTHSTIVAPAHTNVRAVESVLSRATAEMSADHSEFTGVRPQTIAFYVAGAVAVALTLLRQAFAGFWFHPIGFLLGSSQVVSGAWGSLLLAWLFRLLALRMGGAATVRDKLRPFAVGILLGTVMAAGVAVLVNSLVWVTSPGIELFHLNVSPS